MKLRRLLASAGVALAVLLGRLPDARAAEVFFRDGRFAISGGALSGGGSGDVELLTGDVVRAATSPLVAPQSLLAEVLVCNTFSVCDDGLTLNLADGALTTPGVGPLWMDPLLMKATFTITVPSASGGGNTLTASVTMTGTGPYSHPPVVVVGPPPVLVGGEAALGRDGTIAGTVSSTGLGFTGTFATGDGASLFEGATVSVYAP